MEVLADSTARSQEQSSEVQPHIAGAILEKVLEKLPSLVGPVILKSIESSLQETIPVYMDAALKMNGVGVSLPHAAVIQNDESSVISEPAAAGDSVSAEVANPSPIPGFLSLSVLEDVSSVQNTVAQVASSSRNVSCSEFLEVVSQARINVPLCVQGDAPKLMILDMPRVCVESDSRVPDFSGMQALAESMDDFNNPFFGLSQNVFQNFLDGIKGDDVSSCVSGSRSHDKLNSSVSASSCAAPACL
jgi:hypothetical protein